MYSRPTDRMIFEIKYFPRNQPTINNKKQRENKFCAQKSPRSRTAERPRDQIFKHTDGRQNFFLQNSFVTKKNEKGLNLLDEITIETFLSKPLSITS